MAEEISSEQEIDLTNERAWIRTVSDPHEGIALSKDAYRRALETGYNKGQAAALLNIGWGHCYTAQYENALTSFLDALDVFRGARDRRGETFATLAIGVVHHTIGQLKTARRHYEKSLKIAQEIHDRDREAAAINSIGEIRLSGGETEKALEAFESAIAIASPDNAGFRASVMINRATALHSLGRSVDAEGELSRALASARTLGNRVGEARSLVELGRFFHAQQRWDEAYDTYRACVGVCEENGNKLGLVACLKHLGALHRDRGEDGESLGCYEYAIETATSIGTLSNVCDCLYEISEIYERRGDYPHALEYSRRFADAQHAVITSETTSKVKTLVLQHEKDSVDRQSEIYRLRNVELAEAHARLSTIVRIGREITASLEIGRVVATLYAGIREVLDARTFAIGLVDSDSGVLVYKYGIENERPVEPVSIPLDSETSFGAYVVRTNSEVVFSDSDVEADRFVKNWNTGRPGRVRSGLYMPLNTGNTTIGVVTVQSEQVSAYADHHVEIIRALASYVTIAIENSLFVERINQLNSALQSEKNDLQRANREIKHMANHDNLTGLPNRRLVMELLSDSLEMARRRGNLVGVVFLDLDNFKPINDTYGHTVGDGVLAQVAKRVSDALRQSDIIARVGGDEFIAVVRDVESRDAVETVVKKILAVLSAPIELDDVKYPVHASLGVAVFPHDADQVETLITRADDAMYRVKQREKNGYSFYADTEGL